MTNTLFRCSSLSKLMTNPKLKADIEAGNLSETTKTYLLEVYISEKYNRDKNVTSKYMEKGLLVEEDSITLYSRVMKKFFKKNESKLSNEFIKGTPDLYTGLEITEADLVIDIKSSWDIFSFFKVKFDNSINKDYWWQLQGYMALTGASKAKLVYCLVDTPDTLIEDEKRKLLYKMNAGTTENEDYIIACEELERSMRFSDIPMEDRVIEYSIDRDDKAIAQLYDRIERCRMYLNELEVVS